MKKGTRARRPRTSVQPRQPPPRGTVFAEPCDVESWAARFQAFVAGKIRAASTAITPPYRTVIDAQVPGLVCLETRWTRTAFGGPFYVTPPRDSRPSCSLVFVQSADGNTAGANPSSLGGGATDFHVVYEGLSRVSADAVLLGAGTLHGGRSIFSVWHPDLVALRRSLGLARHPIQIVATLRGVDLEHALLFNVPEVPVVLLTVGAGACAMHESLTSRPWIHPLIMTQDTDLIAAFAALREQGIERISCVGGRTLANTLLDAGLVDDVYVTTAAGPGGQPDSALSPRACDGDVLVRKHGSGPESGVVFEHVHVRG